MEAIKNPMLWEVDQDQDFGRAWKERKDQQRFGVHICQILITVSREQNILRIGSSLEITSSVPGNPPRRFWFSLGIQHVDSASISPRVRVVATRSECRRKQLVF